MKQHTFSKAERLKSRKLIDHLFKGGRSFSVYPVKVLYDIVELKSEVPLQGGVTVSSRNFKKAVHRNRIKRLLREVFRLNKLPLLKLLEDNNLQLAVFFIYTGKELPLFEELNLKMTSAIDRLLEVAAKAKKS